MDIIYIRELKIDCVIGVWDWERKIKQRVLIDLDMAFNIDKAAKSDKLEDTLDYKAVSKRLQQAVGDSSFQLLESLAEFVSQILLEEFSIPWIRLRLNKKSALSNAEDVGVIIERGNPSPTTAKK